MGRTDQSLMEQMKITARDIARRKAYIDFGEDDARILEKQKPAVSDNIDLVVDRFYKCLLVFDEMDRLIGDAGSLARLRNYQQQYILTLFDGQYDEEYVHSRLRIGLVHRRIGLDPTYYLAAVHHLTRILQEVLIQGAGRDCGACARSLSSLDKIMMFDLSLIVDTYINSLMEDSRQSREKLSEYAASLEETVAARTRLLEEQARHDGLTGLLNQHAFYQELKRELSRSSRLNHPVCLVYFDLDGFKRLNDTEGHKAGDEVLKQVAEVMGQVCRQNEITARYGGDEFCVILPESRLDQGRVMADRLSRALEPVLTEKGVACSFGLAESTLKTPLDADSLVKQADKAMYLAKAEPGFTIRFIADDAR